MTEEIYKKLQAKYGGKGCTATYTSGYKQYALKSELPKSGASKISWVKRGKAV